MSSWILENLCKNAFYRTGLYFSENVYIPLFLSQKNEYQVTIWGPDPRALGTQKMDTVPNIGNIIIKLK